MKDQKTLDFEEEAGTPGARQPNPQAIKVKAPLYNPDLEKRKDALAKDLDDANQDLIRLLRDRARLSAPVADDFLAPELMTFRIGGLVVVSTSNPAAKMLFKKLLKKHQLKMK